MSSTGFRQQLAELITSAAEDGPTILGVLVEFEERLRLELRRDRGRTDQTRAVGRNLSTREAARRLGLSESYLYKHVEALPFATRIGRRVVCDEGLLEKWRRDRLSAAKG